MLLKCSMLKPHKALCSTNIFAAAIAPLGTSLYLNQLWGTKAAHRWRTQSNTDAAFVYLLHHFNGSKSFISVLTGFRIFSGGPQNSTTKRTTRDYSKKIGTAAKLFRWTVKYLLTQVQRCSTHLSTDARCKDPLPQFQYPKATSSRAWSHCCSQNRSPKHSRHCSQSNSRGQVQCLSHDCSHSQEQSEPQL